MADEKKKSAKKKPEKKKVQLKDLSTTKDQVTEEQARNVKGGDGPPPDPFPTKYTGS